MELSTKETMERDNTSSCAGRDCKSSPPRLKLPLKSLTIKFTIKKHSPDRTTYRIPFFTWMESGNDF